MGDPQPCTAPSVTPSPARLEINALPGGRFAVEFYQKGCCRRRSCRTAPCVTCCWWLPSRRAPTLMVLNEPETSLH
jgi:predicted ATPase